MRLKIPSPVPFCTFRRWENKASLMSHQIGTKCGCPYFLPAFLPLTLCVILFTSKIKECGLGCLHEKTRTNASSMAGWVLDLLLHLYIFKFSHHHISIVTTLSWIDENYACITHSSPAPEWNSMSGTATAWGELAPVRQFLVVSCKRIQNHEREPGWTHPSIM